MVHRVPKVQGVSGAPGRRWVRTIVDKVIAAKVHALTVAWRSSRRVAEMTGMKRTTIDRARTGRSLKPATWQKIAEAIATLPSVPPTTSQATRLHAASCIRSKTTKMPLCVTCRERHVYPRRGNSIEPQDKTPRTVCYKCESASSETSFASCAHCGHITKSLLEANFCCFILPETPGHCGWCGEDSERAFCKKSCSVAYHADRSNGLYGERMTPSTMG